MADQKENRRIAVPRIYVMSLHLLELIMERLGLGPGMRAHPTAQDEDAVAPFPSSHPHCCLCVDGGVECHRLQPILLK